MQGGSPPLLKFQAYLGLRAQPVSRRPLLYFPHKFITRPPPFLLSAWPLSPIPIPVAAPFLLRQLVAGGLSTCHLKRYALSLAYLPLKPNS